MSNWGNLTLFSKLKQHRQLTIREWFTSSIDARPHALFVFDSELLTYDLDLLSHINQGRSQPSSQKSGHTSNS